MQKMDCEDNETVPLRPVSVLLFSRETEPIGEVLQGITSHD